jgi:sulfatase maturation enzyme AslB (radical SAM superfamily)
MSWQSVPQCERCWIEANSTYDTFVTSAETAEQRIVNIKMPFVMQQPVAEVCHFCGEPTIIGIYVRAEVNT